MKSAKSKTALLLVIVLCSSFITSCAPERLAELLPERGQQEIVRSEENRQQAKESEADKKSLDQPEPEQSEQEQTKSEQEQTKPEQISVGKYAYEHLGEQEQVVYDEMLSAILSHEEKVKLSTTDTELMRRAYTAVCGDYGGLFWVEGYVFTRYTKGEELVSLEFSPKYTMTEEERKSTQEQIDGIVNAWLSGISINDTDYDKAKYVYEILALNTEYVQDAADSQNIISVFIRQQTVCQGYACAVQYLLGQLGIQSVIVSGTALGEPHAWNLICLDGAYYYMDATWGNNSYRNGEGVETSFIDYNYMTMTTEEMQMNHVPDSEMVLPECTAVMNNYYWKEGNYIEEWEPEHIGMLLSEAWEQNRVITLRFSDESLRRQAFKYFVEEGHIGDYCSNITEINYIEDSMWKEISFCFNQ